mgnify:CR=1 FL=1
MSLIKQKYRKWAVSIRQKFGPDDIVFFRILGAVVVVALGAFLFL